MKLRLWLAAAVGLFALGVTMPARSNLVVAQWGGGVAPGPGCALATTFLNRADVIAAGIPADVANANKYKIMICQMGVDGLINGNLTTTAPPTGGCGSKIAVLYLLGTRSTAAANLNICTSANSTITPSSPTPPTFVANAGYTGVEQSGTATIYLDTNFIVSSLGIASLNSVHAFGWSGTGPVAGESVGALFGVSSAVGDVSLFPAFTDGLAYARLNSASVSSTTPSTNAAGAWLLNRVASTNFDIYKNNGTPVNFTDSAAGPPTTFTVGLLATHGAAWTFGAGLQIGAASFGAGLGATDRTSLYHNVCVFLTGGTC